MAGEKPLNRRQFNIRLDDERATMLERLAQLVAEGSRSAAVGMLIDLHGGKLIQRALQEVEQGPAIANVEVIRWRAPKLSEPLIAFVAGLVRAGNMPEVACQIAGIPPRTMSQWNKQGRTDRAAAKESLYSDWVAAIEKCEAECEAEDIARLREHGEKTWTALAWRLERQYPDRYAQRKRIDGKVQHSVFPVVDWDRLTAAETRTLVELLRKASPEVEEPGISRTARPALELVPGDILEIAPEDVREEPAGAG